MRKNYITPKALCLVMDEPLMQSASITYSDSKVDNGRPMLSRRRHGRAYVEEEYWEEDPEMDFE